MRLSVASLKESKSWHLLLRFVFVFACLFLFFVLFCFVLLFFFFTERQASFLSLQDGCVFTVFGFRNLFLLNV